MEQYCTGRESSLFWKLFCILFFKLGVRRNFTKILKKINNFYIGNFFLVFLKSVSQAAPIKKKYSFGNTSRVKCSPLFKQFLNTKGFSSYLNFQKSLKASLKFLTLDFRYFAHLKGVDKFIFFFEKNVFKNAPSRVLI